MNRIKKFISVLKAKPFIKSLINDLNAEVFVVGGATRDLILNKENKDIDLLIRKISIDDLISHLQKFGRLDVVGKSFGVIKFIDSDGIDYDIALPRKESPTGNGGHKDFEIQSDENLPIDVDLSRRDAKLNAMAIDLNNGKFIDPLDGLNDIENKQISAANPNAFSDDPLRMLRMIGFASRFGFTIEPKTMEMIQKNAESIKKIPAERIIEEFKKIIEKGSPRVGVELLVSTGLFKQIFGNEIKQSQIDERDFENAKTMADFLFLMMHGVVQNPSQYYLSRFSTEDAKRDKNYNIIRALEMAFANTNDNPVATRSVAHNMYVISPASLESNILPQAIKIAANELLSGKYPKTVNELAINGNDLMELGLKGKEVGDMQKSLLLKVYGDKVHNDKNSLLAVAKGEEPDTLDEAKRKQFDYKYEEEPFYFDPATVSDKKWQVITKILTRMGWEARPYTDWKEYFLQMGAGIIPSDKLDADWSNDASKIIAIKQALAPKEKPSDEQAIITKAKRIFGTTTNYKMAGYLLLDGTMLDFSGYRQGNRYSTSRVIDHREVNSSGANMLEFMAMGNIRLQSNGFELTQEPTRQQLKTLLRFLAQINDDIRIDFAEKNSYHVEHSVSYPKDTRPNRILNDVLNYYRNSVKPVAPMIAEEENIVNNDVLYSAVVLDEKSRSKLLKVVQPMIPDGWEVIAHHMTIKLGAINPENRGDLNSEVTLNVVDYAIDDMAFAVGVSGYPSNNKKPHITIAINRLEGAKPVMSNNLTNWKPLGFPLELNGIITEIKRN